jgi:hypothetical protein
MLTGGLFLASLLIPVVAQAQSASVGVPVRLVPSASGGVHLLRGGKPYIVKGAGGSGQLELLVQCGGNSIRTWGADDLEPLLDKAHHLGLTVCVGIWFGHKEQGFHYDDPKQVAEQQERVRQAVLKYRNHPAVLMWALGNEMEGYDQGNDPLVWKAVEDAARLVKELDPTHPTMTVIAEVGGQKVQSIHRYCPDIDIVGINSYGGGPSLPVRYKAAGGTKPYIITEYGPPGTWEVGKNSWGAPAELSSTEKAKAYRATYDEAIKKDPNCLGGYAFTWGNKQEATATWYGMLLPDGSKLAAVDALTEEWTGKLPTKRCPEILALTLSGEDRVLPGAKITALLKAHDPDGKPVQVHWVLQQDPMQVSLNGDSQKTPPIYPEAIAKASAEGVQVTMPSQEGAYRLFAFLSDGDGGAAVGNIPLFVTKNRESSWANPGKKAKLPLVLYAEREGERPYEPTGWMGNRNAMQIKEDWHVNPHSGASCIRFDYTATGDWGGVAWQSPPNDWGDLPGGWNVTGAKRLTFWARGEEGGEGVEFSFGLLGADKKFGDSGHGKMARVSLTREWKQYSFDLAGSDLSCIKTGFCCVIAGQGKPITFYLDDIQFE